MANLKKHLVIVAGVCLSLGLAMISCGGEDSGDGDSNDGKESKPTNKRKSALSDSASGTLAIDGIHFSVPSPFQTVSLIKNSGASFNDEMVNPPDKKSTYVTEFSKALNLGIYGADLGYITIYQQNDRALSYISTVTSLADELNVSGAFSEELINRFQDNIDQKDSILVLVSEAYRNGNDFLQQEERYKVIGLILAGGWIESLHFACEIAKTNFSQKVMNRIGDQKASLKGLIKLLERHRNEDLTDDFVTRLIDLEKVFNELKYEYNYKKPKTLPDKKKTYITSPSSVKITKDQLASITKKIREIRSTIIE